VEGEVEFFGGELACHAEDAVVGYEGFEVAA
jgi:hypothetical protein